MNPPRVPAKVGIVLGGLIVALAIAWLAVDLRQRATQGPDAQASAGMYAAGDAMVGVAVFGVLALVPLALGLFWLRPVARFWFALTGGAMLLSLTGVLAVAGNAWDMFPATGWALLLSHVRFALLPLTALAFLTCAVFAPEKRHRWLLAAAAIADGGLFTGVVFVKFFLRP